MDLSNKQIARGAEWCYWLAALNYVLFIVGSWYSGHYVWISAATGAYCHGVWYWLQKFLKDVEELNGRSNRS